MITIELLKLLCPSTSTDTLQQYISPLNSLCQQNKILDNKFRIAAFLAEIIVESGYFKATKENLNYSAASLLKVFPKYFPTQHIADEYAHQPEKIANKVYANRMGNGSEASGDGAKYCGRGLIQLTGKETYTNFAKSLDKSLEDAILYLRTPEGATDAATWFWNHNALNKYADKQDITHISKVINGGTNGLQTRIELYNMALKHL